MGITRSSVHVSIPVERLIRDLILGSESLDKGVAQLLPSSQKQVTLNRFFTTGDNITARTPKPTITNDASEKDEKQIVMTDIQWYNEYDPKEFNLDWEFLWATGASGLQEPSAVLIDAIMPSVTENFNNTLERMLWQGDTAGGGSIALFDGWEKRFAADVDVIDVTPVGAITAANVISIFEAMLAAAPAELREKGNPSFIVPHAVKYVYDEASRALSFKGVDITQGEVDLFGGYPVISVNGRSDSNCSFLNAGSGDQSELKVAVWADQDRFTVEMARTAPLDDTFGIKIAASVGVGEVYGKQIVNYIPV